MGRAIVREPQVFLMDEPLSNLDAKLRVQTRTQIAALQRRLGVTTVYVTHDQVEAMTMGDRVAVLKDGMLQQCDTPAALYDHPANVFVAGFIGSPAMNLLEVVRRRWRREVRIRHHPRQARSFWTAPARRSSSASVPRTSRSPPTARALPVTVEVVEELGADAYIYGSTSETAADVKPIIVRVDGRNPPAKGAVVHLSPKGDHVHLFHSESGLRLGD